MADKVYDLAAIVKRERKRIPPVVVKTPDGQKWELDRPILWPDAALDAANADRPVDAMRLVLGERYDAFVQAGGSSSAAFLAIREELGLDLPESPASTDSSKSTGRQSKRTSSA